MKAKSRAADMSALLAALGLLVWFLSEAERARTEAALVAAGFAVAGWLLKGVDAAGAVAGGMIAFLYYAVGGWPLFGCLFLVFVLTWLATRAGGSRKEQLGIAETSAGRSASQVAANLLVSVVCIVAAAVGHFRHDLLLNLAGLAALVEAAADTVSSEIGEAFGGTPRLITTLQKVAPGTDGGITLIGSVAGTLAAFSFGGITVYLFDARFELALLISLAATVGMFADSLLGATLEREGYLTNDGVNLVATGLSAGLVLIAGRLF